MNLTQDWNKLISNKSLLQSDEWYISNFIAREIDSLTPEEAFQNIEEVCTLLKNSETDFLADVLNLLMSLMRKVDTTEIPKALIFTLNEIEEKEDYFNKAYVKNQIDEIRQWYRIE